MTPDTWDSLGWHKQRALVEGLESEGVISRGGAKPSAGASPGASSDSGFIDLTDAGDDEFRGMGFNVQ